MLAVKARDGATVKIKLADDARVTGMSRMKLEDVNAAVSEMVEANDGKTLTMRYKDGEKKIILNSQTQY